MSRHKHPTQAGEAGISLQDITIPDPAPPPPRRRRRFAGLVWGLAVVAIVAGLGLFAVLGLTGKPIRLPVWLVAEAEARINHAMTTGASVALGGAVVLVDAGWVPRLQLEDLRLLTAAGAAIATLPEVQVVIDPDRLLAGEVRPRSLRIVGAQVTLQRLADGRFDLVIGALDGPPPGNLAELLDRIEAAFNLPMLSALDRIDAEALTLTLDDRRSGRLWQVGDGRLSVENRAGSLALELGFGLVGGAAPAQADLTFVSDKTSSAARISATVDQVAARDLAAQAPALAWLGVLDAPISGRLSATLDAAGHLLGTDGALKIGAGALHPTTATAPVPFEQAGMTFAVDTAAETIRFSDLSVQSTSLRVTASGLTRVPGLAAGHVTSLISQVSISNLLVDPAGLFQEPVQFSQGALDLRMTLDPFRLEIGQMALSEGKTRLVAKGSAQAEPTGWAVSIDVGLNEIRHDKLLGLWPVLLVPKTRAWLAANVQEGLLSDVKAALRLAPGQEAKLSLGYEFADADVRFLRTLPPIKQGFGYATLLDQTYTIYLEQGNVTPPEGGRIDVAGSVFQVKDITQKPAPAQITLKTDSTITAAMSLLDQPPFNFLTKAGYPVSVADGHAVATAVLNMPLKPKIEMSDVTYTVTGVLSGVSSDRLVQGRMLRADRLTLAADNAGMSISGPGVLGQAAFDATWTQAFGPQAKGHSTVDGTIEVSDASLAEFSVRLPDTAVTGRATGRITMDLTRGGGGTFRITSDLKGVGLSLPAINLAKPAGDTAALQVDGRLGKPASIERLTLKSGSVSAEGSVALRADGGLDVARFTSVKSGDWLDAAVEITGQGPGKPVAIAVTGGSIDLRRLPAGGSTGADGAPPLDVALDRLSITEGIALTGLRGRFTAKGGLSGDFTARVNGTAPVRGSVAQTRNGTAARIKSEDAGAVIAAAGIFERARGGALDLTLTPRGGADGYDGTAVVTDIQVRDAPILADLLGAISVIGLLEQLNNSGLVFSRAEAAFHAGSAGVEVSRSSAVGASLGVSLNGTYTSATRALNMQGVISPIYLLNGIGSILTRPGEGLFGFNYTLRGTAVAPEVSVNPLSILTPGMFRDIFRAAPPQQGG